MNNAVIGLFDSAVEASSVQKQLIALGIPASGIQLQATASGTSSTSSSTSTSEEGTGFWEGIKELFGGGDDSHYADYYAEGTRRGATLVTVSATDELAERAAELMRQQGAVNVDERAAEWQKQGWKATATNATTATAGQTPASLKVAQEQLEVGKRQVARGGVRIVRRVIETPVEQEVKLREERVNVTRRAVSRDLTGAEVDAAFSDKTMELTETGEEAVAAKSAKIVEEVVMDKDIAERTEKVRDTVRKTDVRVERIPGQTVEGTSSKTQNTAELDRATGATRKSASQQ